MQPQKYERTTDFTERDGDDTDHSALNQELDEAALSINQVRDNLALIQRDDGALANGIVTADSLDDSAFSAIKASVDQAVTEAETAANAANIAAASANDARDMAVAAKHAVETARDASQINANNANASAVAALASKTSAANSATTATTQAGISTTKAGEAASSAAAALASKNDAINSQMAAASSRDAADASEASAADSATVASTKADEAAASAAAALLSESGAKSSLDMVTSIVASTVGPGLLGAEKAPGEIFQSAAPITAPTLNITDTDGDTFTVYYDNPSYAKVYFTTTGADALSEIVLKNRTKIMGTRYVDAVYLDTGSYCDFSGTLGAVDKLYIPGARSDYTYSLSVDGVLLYYFRVLSDGRLEGGIMSTSGTTTTSDWMVFTDGKVATADFKTALLAGTMPVLDTSVVYSGTPPSGLPVASGLLPTNWLFADGSAVSREHYPRLFAVIGTTYGAGDGTTTFNLPAIDPVDKTLTPHSGIAGVWTYIQA